MYTEGLGENIRQGPANHWAGGNSSHPTGIGTRLVAEICGSVRGLAARSASSIRRPSRIRGSVANPVFL